MIWLRRILTSLLSVLLFICLMAVVTAVSFNLNLSKPDRVESWLQQSDIYGHWIADVTNQSQQSTGGQDNSGSVSLSDAAVKQAAESAFSPKLIQSDVQEFLDGNYSWLQGKTDKPQFNINLTSAKAQFANQVGQYVKTYLKGLPVCTTGQLSQILNPNQDPLSLTCRPAAMNVDAEADQVTQQLANGSNFMSNTLITPATLTAGDESSQPYFTKVSFLPKIYSWAKKLPLILAVSSVVLTVLIFFSATTRRRGVRRIAEIFMLSGVLLLLKKLVADIAIKHINYDKVRTHLFGGADNASSGPLQHSLQNFVQRAVDSLTKPDLWFGAAFVLFAGILILLLVLSRERRLRLPALPQLPNRQPNESSAPAVKPEPAPVVPKLAPAKRSVSIDGLAPKPTARPRPTNLRPMSTNSGQPKPKTRKPPRLIQ
ncbi:MAG TPA: hypothetical protein VG604_03690 [Candidatus Saccharimonadales bacterium]|nr:hypothetical protein [Candidatus Saccharimonadales bacterium]